MFKNVLKSTASGSRLGFASVRISGSFRLAPRVRFRSRALRTHLKVFQISVKEQAYGLWT